MKTLKKIKEQPKKVVENYKKETPITARVVGDGLVLVGAIATLFIPGAKWAIAIGLVGKYISDQFGKK